MATRKERTIATCSPRIIGPMAGANTRETNASCPALAISTAPRRTLTQVATPSAPTSEKYSSSSRVTATTNRLSVYLPGKQTRQRCSSSNSHIPSTMCPLAWRSCSCPLVELSSSVSVGKSNNTLQTWWGKCTWMTKLWTVCIRTQTGATF